VENPLPKQRARSDFHKHPLFYAVRNHIIDFLVSRSRTFIKEMGGAFDPRHVKVVRPGLPEPSIAKKQDFSASLPGLTRQSIAKA
jgi:nitrate/nitrite transport system ATP-binding protein